MDNKPQKDNSRQILAYILIGVGSLWLIRRIGFYFDFPFHVFQNIFEPFRQVFHRIGDFVFSWQMVLIIVGAVLLAGKRSAGLILIIIGAIFILPKVAIFSGLTLSLLLPLMLVAIGIAIIARKI